MVEIDVAENGCANDAGARPSNVEGTGPFTAVTSTAGAGRRPIETDASLAHGAGRPTCDSDSVDRDTNVSGDGVEGTEFAELCRAVRGIVTPSESGECGESRKDGEFNEYDEHGRHGNGTEADRDAGAKAQRGITSSGGDESPSCGTSRPSSDTASPGNTFDGRGRPRGRIAGSPGRRARRSLARPARTAGEAGCCCPAGRETARAAAATV
jgi:hypothetical protein